MTVGNGLILAGIVLILAGAAYKFGLLGWFGNLPGDIKYEEKNTRFYFPIVTMLVLSVVLSIFLSFFRK